MEQKTPLFNYVNVFVQKQKQLLAEIESSGGNEKYYVNLLGKWDTYLKKQYGENYKDKFQNSFCGSISVPIQLSSDDAPPSTELNSLDVLCLSHLLDKKVEALSDTFIAYEWSEKLNEKN